VAGDLIPPPSPAGRPDADGRAEYRTDERPVRVFEAEAPPEATAAVAAEPDAPTPYRSRFGFALGALGGLAMISLVVLIALLTAGRKTDPSTLTGSWSSWKPTAADRLTGAKEIAAHVGARYKRGDGSQLVQVAGGPLQVSFGSGVQRQSVGLDVILRPENGNLQEIPGDHAVMYILNGLGQRGSIRSGRPTEARGLLTRREGLELALYSFRYLEDVDMVVTMLPPPPPGTAADGTKSKQGGESEAPAEDPPILALFYRPGDLEPQLDVPLEYTLPPTPPKPESFAGPEAQRVNALTEQNVFQASFQTAQNSQTYLVLERGASE